MEQNFIGTILKKEFEINKNDTNNNIYVIKIYIKAKNRIAPKSKKNVKYFNTRLIIHKNKKTK